MVFRLPGHPIGISLGFSTELPADACSSKRGEGFMLETQSLKFLRRLHFSESVPVPSVLKLH